MGTRVGIVAVCLTFLLWLPKARAADWPMFGRDSSRNPVSPEKGAPLEWHIDQRDEKGRITAPGFNLKWSAELGFGVVGSPVVANGLVWVCTENSGPNDPPTKKDASVLRCLDERDGRLLWQHLTPRFPDRNVDWPGGAAASPPLVEGNRLWFLTNHWEVVCFDLSPLLARTGEPREVWKLNMPKELGITPLTPGMGFNIHCAIGASYHGRIYVITGNGASVFTHHAATPDAPSLICLDKDSGKVLWRDNSPGAEVLEGQWGSPLVAEIGGRAQVVAPMGDGWLRSFDPDTGKLLWKFDANPKSSTYPQSRNLLLSPPVLYEGLVYVTVGQTVEHSEGDGLLWCIDPTKGSDGQDVSEELDGGPAGQSNRPGAARLGKPNPNSAVVWKFDRAPLPPGRTRVLRSDKMNRATSSVAATDGLVIASDFSGFVHCLDSKTGKRYWVCDTESSIGGSPLICDGKIYVQTEDGDVFVFALSRQMTLLAKNPTGEGTLASPVFANGVLYAAARQRLYAINDPKATRRPASRPVSIPPATRPYTAVNVNGERVVPSAIFFTTPQDVVEKMLEVAGVTRNDVVYDLGCGDGRIVVTAARKYGCRAIGYDIDAECVRLARDAVRRANMEALVEIGQKNMFVTDFHDATVVTLYVGRDNNRRLLPELRKLKPGSRIVSHNFDIEGVPADKVVDFTSTDDDTKHTIYLWTTPLKKNVSNDSHR